jgi:predicted MPP superfamily phosphohydrolase
VFVNFSRNSLFFFRKAGSLWMAIFFYMLFLLAVSDLIRLFLYITGKQIQNFQLYAVGGSIFICILLIAFGMLNARLIKTVSYDVTLSGSGSNFRILLISDLHIGNTVNKLWIDRVTAEVNKAEPDMVCIAGDIFDGNIDIINDLHGIISSFGEIKAPLGVYACLGNHDVDRRHGNSERMKSILSSAGIITLNDESRKIRDNLHIAGRKDARPIGMSAQRKTVEDLCENLEGTIIMLDHQPAEFVQSEQAGIDLLLCGHTHKGQVFPATFIAREIFKKSGTTSYGYWKGQTMQAVVTSGAGVWGPPIRIGTKSEVVIINVSFVL